MLLLVLFCATSATAVAKLADGCRHVYVDSTVASTVIHTRTNTHLPLIKPLDLVGTNIGHQIRKVFEPSSCVFLFVSTSDPTHENADPNNPTEPLFKRWFGDQLADRLAVCAFGFEASPHHTTRLRALEIAYQQRGIHVNVFNAAVSTKDGNLTFYIDKIADKNSHNDWAANSGRAEATAGTPNKQRDEITVRSIDINAWMNREVHGRIIPSALEGALPPAILMKSDDENEDMFALSHMLVGGSLCAATHRLFAVMFLSSPPTDAPSTRCMAST